MAIEVQHQPVGAIYSLATQAGQAAAERERIQRNEQRQLLGMKLGHDRAQQEFMVKAQQAARAEEAQYQMLLIQAKRQIDIQTETADYARQKQKLTMALNMINESDEIGEEDRERLRIQAMAKYAGVGSGISSQDFQKNTRLVEELQRGAFRATMINELERSTEAGQLDPQTAENLSRAYGTPGAKFYAPGERIAEEVDTASSRLKSAQDTLAKHFYKQGKQVYNSEDNKIKPSDPEYSVYETLQKQVQDAKKELDRLSDVSEQDKVFRDFASKVNQGDPFAVELIRRFGGDVEKAFDEYEKGLTKLNTTDPTDMSFTERHPLLSKALMGPSGAIGMKAKGTTESIMQDIKGVFR